MSHPGVPTPPWTGTRRNAAYKAAAQKFAQALQEWEEFLREDAYRTAGEIVKAMYPNRPGLRDLLDEIANQVTGEESP